MSACIECAQIGSSTWATHLLRMAGVPIYRRTPIHSLARETFPPLLGRRKETFLATAESFIVARDPFERLLSSYKVRTQIFFILSQIFFLILRHKYSLFIILVHGKIKVFV